MKHTLNDIVMGIGIGVLGMTLLSVGLNNITIRRTSTKIPMTLNHLLDRIALVESDGNNNVIGSNDERGEYQLSKIYVDDLNRILGRKVFTYTDRLNPNCARAMTAIYLLHYGKGLTLFQMAQIHNGGPKGYLKKSTINYANKIFNITK